MANPFVVSDQEAQDAYKHALTKVSRRKVLLRVEHYSHSRHYVQVETDYPGMIGNCEIRAVPVPGYVDLWYQPFYCGQPVEREWHDGTRTPAGVSLTIKGAIDTLAFSLGCTVRPVPGSLARLEE